MSGPSTWHQGLQAVLHRRGLHLTRYQSTIHGRRAKLLRHAGVDVLLDVGANRGQYAAERRRHGYRGRLVSFEPLAAPFAELERLAQADPTWVAHRVAVGDRDGTVDIRVSQDDIYSSVLPVTSAAVAADARSATASVETVPMRTLDGLSGGLEGTLGVKVDVQGFESHVVDGATETLRRAVYLEMELSLVPVYDGQVLVAEQLARLGSLGYTLAATENLFPDRTSGRALQLNGIFLRG